MALPTTRPARQVLKELWLGAGLPETNLGGAEICLDNASSHVLPSSFRLGCAAQVSIAATALAKSLLDSLSTSPSRPMQVRVDARHAALEFASEKFSRLKSDIDKDSEAVQPADAAFKEMLGLSPDKPAEWDPLAGYYRCADDRHVRLHTNWEHHKLGLLRILGLANEASREQAAAALLCWNAEQFETAAREAGMCATMCRTPKEWQETEVGLSLRAWLDDDHGCPVRVSRAASASPPARSAYEKRRLRIIDMSRVIAAPVAGRTLARHGADVLLVSSMNLPHLPMLELDTGRGKRAAEVDLDSPDGKMRLEELVSDADVLLQAYRPGALAKRGFSLQDLQRLRPGLIYAELSAYGFTGPWKHVRGFDSLVQSASGINSSEADSYQSHLSSKGETSRGKEQRGPLVLPCQALDHASGHLLAFGILAAKCRSLLQAEEDKGEHGWHVQVSLAGTAAWVESLGRVHGDEAWEAPSPIDCNSNEVATLLEPYPVRGARQPQTLYSIKHAAQGLEAIAQSVPARLDVDRPEWA